MNVAFTGTRRGMTSLQRESCLLSLKWLNPTKVHHGDCIGSDADFHELSHLLNGIKIYIHPPDISTYRAFKGDAYHIYEESPYIARNHFMIQQCPILIATPGEWLEQRRSGTWATIRYARKLSKNILIIYPGGNITGEP